MSAGTCTTRYAEVTHVSNFENMYVLDVFMCVKYFEVYVYIITCVCCRNHTCAATEKKNIIRIENMYVLNDYISVHLCVMYIHIYVYNMSVRSKQMTSACGQDHA